MTGRYWDPVPYIDELAGQPVGESTDVMIDDARWIFAGTWQERNWRNVPGPIYGATTDNCWVGRVSAPHHVLYGGDGEQEFLFRQPKNASELVLVLDAAQQDPFAGWARDGDAHWTPELVAEWWAGRDRLESWIETKRDEWSRPAANADELDAALGLSEYLDYLHDGLYQDLRVYAFWLANRRSPVEGEVLPAFAV